MGSVEGIDATCGCRGNGRHGDGVATAIYPYWVLYGMPGRAEGRGGGAGRKRGRSPQTAAERCSVRERQKPPSQRQMCTSWQRIRPRLYARITPHVSCGLGRLCNHPQRLDIRVLEVESKNVLGSNGTPTSPDFVTSFTSSPAFSIHNPTAALPMTSSQVARFLPESRQILQIGNLWRK
jgi:hypothetical protein